MRRRKCLCQSCCSPCVLSAADLVVPGKNLCSHPFLLQGFAWSQRVLALRRMSAAFPFALLSVVCSCPPEQLCPRYQSFCFQDGKSALVAADIFLYQKPWKKQRTHSHAEASSLEKWGNQQSSASVRPPSRIISPCAHCVLHDAPECP